MAVTLAKSTIGQRAQLGPQTDSGTGVAATRRMPTMIVMISAATESNKYRAQGNKFTSVLVPNKESSTWKGDGVASYGEMPAIFTSLLAAAAPVGSGPYTWTMKPTDGAPDTPQLFTWEMGDDTDAIQTIDNVVTDFNLEFDRTAAKASIAGFGKAITKAFTLTSQAAVWTLTITGTPTGGTFTVSFGGQTTSGIAYNATASVVQTALAALSSIGTGNVAVTGSGGGPYTVKLINALNGASGAITASGASLTGGTSPGVTPAQTGAGVSFYENKPVIPGTVAVYLDTTAAGIGTTKLTNVLSGKFGLTGRWGQEWIVDDDDTSYAKIVETEPKASASLLFEADSTARSYFDNYRAGDVLYLQIRMTGAVISGGVHYSAKINVPVQFGKINEFSDDGGVYALGFDLEPLSDPAAGYPVEVIVVNATATL